MNWSDIHYVLDSAQHICRMPEDILQVLRHRISRTGECSEGRNIREIPLVESADIQAARLAFNYSSCALLYALRQTYA